MSLVIQVVRGAAWAVAFGVSSRALGLIGTLLIVRYLTPVEYGEVSAAFIVVATANQFSTLGLGMFVFSNPNAGRDAVFHATLVHIGLGVGALVSVLLLSAPLGRSLGMPSLVLFVPGLVLSALLERVLFMPERILLRDLRFTYVGSVRAVGELVYTVVSLGLAVEGLGAMSIVDANVARSFVRLAGMVFAANRRDWLAPCRVSLSTIGSMVGYGSTVSIGSLAIFAARRWDNLLIARMFGASTMGSYNLAYNLADVPAAQVGEQVTDVLLASFARMDPDRRSAALVRSCTLLGLVMFPLAVGLGAVAPGIARAFFKPEWSAVAPMLMWLSVLAVLRPVGGALMAYLHSVNQPGTVLRLEWASVVLQLSAMAVLGQLGPLWACAAVGIAFTGRAVAAMMVIGRREGLCLRVFLAGLVGPLAACMLMLTAVLALDAAGEAKGFHPVGLLVSECAAGMVVYVGAALLLAPDGSRKLIRLCRAAFASAPRSSASV